MDVNRDDSNDVLIRIPLYISQSPKNIEHHLLQYPLRPLYRPYGDQGELIGIQHRKKQDTFLFSYALDHQNDIINDEDCTLHYVASRNVTKPPHLSMFGHGKAPTESTASNYSLNALLIKKGKGYIIPNIQAQQFRTIFRQELPDPEKKTFKVGERKQIDHYSLRMLQLQEPYNPIMSVFKVGSLESSNICNKLSRPSDNSVFFNTDISVYLYNITHNIKKDNDEVISLTIGDLKDLDLDEALLKLFSIKEALSFSDVKSLLPHDVEDGELLSKLLDICITVAGNFVIKSELCMTKLHDLKIYNEKAKESIDAMDSYFANCRDLILLIYSSGKNVVPAYVSNVPGFALMSKQLREVFSRIMRPLSKVSSDRSASTFILPSDTKVNELELVRDHTTACQKNMKASVKNLQIKLKELTVALKG